MRPGLGPEPDTTHGPRQKAELCSLPWCTASTARRACIAPVLLTALSVLVLSCTANTRYRILTFFFTGVPEPGAVQVAEEVSAPTSQKELAEAKRRWRTARSRKLYNHLPYAQRRCSECHDISSGKLIRSAREGLCHVCHRGFGDDLQYLHGPVAVNECVFCHHPHGSEHPAMLYTDAKSLCLRCHRIDDLGTEVCRDPNGERPCNDCHNPHGGDDMSFLKRSEP
ncbi:MAG: hypothetical protein JSU63_19685 [Phycisphaerales bacterium]|nr:MAG: hypothetical protein JSU63_19685 [Phycisphaerales bacterium]